MSSRYSTHPVSVASLTKLLNHSRNYTRYRLAWQKRHHGSHPFLFEARPPPSLPPSTTDFSDITSSRSDSYDAVTNHDGQRQPVRTALPPRLVKTNDLMSVPLFCYDVTQTGPCLLGASCAAGPLVTTQAAGAAVVCHVWGAADPRCEAER